MINMMIIMRANGVRQLDWRGRVPRTREKTVIRRNLIDIRLHLPIG